jgi:hypothetical protein
MSRLYDVEQIEQNDDREGDSQKPQQGTTHGDLLRICNGKDKTPRFRNRSGLAPERIDRWTAGAAADNLEGNPVDVT